VERGEGSQKVAGRVGSSEKASHRERKEALVPDDGMGQRHLDLLRAIDEVARRDPAGVSTMYQAAQKIGLNPVGKAADRRECVRLARELEEAGYVEVYAITYQGLRASYSATEEGRRRLAE
jgi:hypothetical protein